MGGVLICMIEIDARHNNWKSCIGSSKRWRGFRCPPQQHCLNYECSSIGCEKCRHVFQESRQEMRGTFGFCDYGIGPTKRDSFLGLACNNGVYDQVDKRNMSAPSR